MTPLKGFIWFTQTEFLAKSLTLFSLKNKGKYFHSILKGAICFHYFSLLFFWRGDLCIKLNFNFRFNDICKMIMSGRKKKLCVFECHEWTERTIIHEPKKQTNKKVFYPFFDSLQRNTRLNLLIVLVSEHLKRSR